MGILEKGAIQPAGSIEERSEQLKELFTSTGCFEFVSAKNEANKSVNTYSLPFNGGRLANMTVSTSGYGFILRKLSNPNETFCDYSAVYARPDTLVSYTKVVENGRGCLLIRTLSSSSTYDSNFYWGTGENGTKIMQFGGGGNECVSAVYDAASYAGWAPNNSGYRQSMIWPQYAFSSKISIDGVRTQDKLIQNMMPMEWQNPTTIIPVATSTEELVGFYSYSNQTVKIKSGEIYNDVLTNKHYYCITATSDSNYGQNGISPACLMEITQ